MAIATRTILVLTLMFAAGLSAQETTATAAAAESAQPAARALPSIYETRNQFTRLVRDHPPELSMLLKLDPSLLSNEAFLAGYPELGRFLEQAPEVRGNPRFYLAEFPVPGQSDSGLDDIVEMLAVVSALLLGVLAFAWLVRTIIEQRRWGRLSRTQSEVHNKILDRFGTSNELLDYIRTPAGTKFLESAPIPLRAEEPVRNAPLTRILWSIQLGVVIAAGGLGMLMVSFRFAGETAQGLFAMGAIAFCIGAGFIASAAVSLFLSRRLGLWPGAAPPSENAAGLMR